MSKKKYYKNYTVSEKRAYWIGVGAGSEHRGDGKTVKDLRIKAKNITDSKSKESFDKGFKKGRKGLGVGAINRKYKNRKKKKDPSAGAYNSRGRINENLVDDRHGPVVFFAGNDFDYDSKGRIKGGYTADGFFEPD